MIIPAASPDDRYSGGDPYATDTQYRDTGPTTVSYGSEYGTGSYSAYNSESGRYTTTIEIAGYGTDASGTGYGYTADDTGHSYSARETAFDYVIDVLDGDVDRPYGDRFCCT